MAENKTKTEAVKAIQRIDELADAFADSSTEKQQRALQILSGQISGEKNKTARGWLTLFRDTMAFTAGKKRKATRADRRDPICPERSAGSEGSRINKP